MVFDPSFWDDYLASAWCSAWHITDTLIFVASLDGRTMPCECLSRHPTLIGFLLDCSRIHRRAHGQEGGVKRSLCRDLYGTTLGPFPRFSFCRKTPIFSHSGSIKVEVHRILLLGQMWVGFCLPPDFSAVLSLDQHSKEQEVVVVYYPWLLSWEELKWQSGNS